MAKANTTVTIQAKVNGLDAMEAYIDALDTVVSQRERIAELEAELAATRRQPMETAPEHGQILAWPRGGLNGCPYPPVVVSRFGAQWIVTSPMITRGVVVGEGSVLISGEAFIGWAPIPTIAGSASIPDNPGTPECHGEPEIDSEQPKVSP